MDYKIDGNIDFYKELQNMKDDPDDTPVNTPMCLISREPLYGRYVSLECGHSFNYLPLFKDIYNHKEGKNSQLKVNQIRCPYCRHIQNSVMPYYPEFNVEQHGINILRPPSKNTIPKIIALKNETQNKDILQSILLNQPINTLPKKAFPNPQEKLCIAILKHGTNKGSQCKNKVLCNFYCGRHSKQLNT
jgi:hypothetical protein